MNVKTYYKLDELKQDYELNPIYVYPIKCKNCKSNIQYKFGLFTCKCRHFILKFAFGVNILHSWSRFLTKSDAVSITTYNKHEIKIIKENLKQKSEVE